MVKIVNVFSIKEGVDSDKLWKNWMTEHAAHMKNAPGLRRYVINRVIEKLPAHRGESEGVKYWGIVEIWFDSVADYHRAMSSTPPPDPNDMWMTSVGPASNSIVEEKVLVG